MTYFINLLKEKNPETEEVKSREWFREKAFAATNLPTTKTIIATNSESYATNVLRGRLYLFQYDAKHKETLPYFDRFPIIIPIRKMSNGFFGINFHYLNFPMRAFLMDGLYSFLNNTTEEFIDIKLSTLMKTEQLRFFKPCFKHYLNKHIRSRFVNINYNEWDTAMFLPVHKFIGAKPNQVYKDSLTQIRKKNG